MSKRRERKRKAVPLEKFLLCQVPPEWTSLPVHTDKETAPPPDSVAMYAKYKMKKHLVYEGYICPNAPETASPMTLMQPPQQPKQTFGRKFEKLMQKIRSEETETTTNSQPEQGVADASTQQVNAEALATSESKNNTHASEEQTECPNLLLQRTQSNSDYPPPQEVLDKEETVLPTEVLNRIESCLPAELLDRMDSFLTAPAEGGTVDFISFMDQWQCTNMDLLNL